MMKSAFVALLSVAASAAEVANTIATVTDKVYFDITIDGMPMDRVVFGLFGDVVPRTVENFVKLAQDDGVSPIDGYELWYEGSPFHRIIPDFMAQGGDFTTGNGEGGESIYGLEFDDENFDLHHTKPYILSMANAGPNTNGSQFFITFEPTPWLDGHHVVFGEVIEGFATIDALEDIGTQSGTPTKHAIISKCNSLEVEE